MMEEMKDGRKNSKIMEGNEGRKEILRDGMRIGRMEGR